MPGCDLGGHRVVHQRVMEEVLSDGRPQLRFGRWRYSIGNQPDVPRLILAGGHSTVANIATRDERSLDLLQFNAVPAYFHLVVSASPETRCCRPQGTGRNRPFCRAGHRRRMDEARMQMPLRPADSSIRARVPRRRCTIRLGRQPERVASPHQGCKPARSRSDGQWVPRKPGCPAVVQPVDRA